MSLVSENKASFALKKLENRSVSDDNWIIVKEFFGGQGNTFQIIERNRVKFQAFQAKILVVTNNLVRGVYTEKEFDEMLQELLAEELIPIKEELSSLARTSDKGMSNSQSGILIKLNDSIESFEGAIKEVIAGDLSLVSVEEERYIQGMSEQAISAGEQVRLYTGNLLSSTKLELLVGVLEQVNQGVQKINDYISTYQGNSKGMEFAWFNFALSEFLGADKLGLLEECYESLISSIEDGGLDDEMVSLFSSYKVMLGNYIQGLHTFKNKIKVLQDKE